MGASFYENLKPVRAFRDVANPDAYQSVPDDWSVIITDVAGSTRAVEEGRYKEVNFLGAASIVAVLNEFPDRDVPYVFGGDGATILVSSDELDRATSALVGLSGLAEHLFDLELRVGVVSIDEIRGDGHDVGVARYALSEHVELAMMWGEGLAHAEELIKSPETSPRYTLEAPSVTVEPDFEGLSCRWEPLATRRGSIVSLIVMARAADGAARAEAYRRVLSHIEDLVEDESQMRPAHRDNARMGSDPDDLDIELKLKTGATSGFRYAAEKTRMRLQTALGRQVLERGWKVGRFDGETYTDQLVLQTDFRKFDDVLRMVVDLTADEFDALICYLDAERDRGGLCYGVHRSESALMTCVLFDSGEHDHVHFIDGGDGGYAIAAKQLKAQLRREDE